MRREVQVDPAPILLVGNPANSLGQLFELRFHIPCKQNGCLRGLDQSATPFEQRDLLVDILGRHRQFIGRTTERTVSCRRMELLAWMNAPKAGRPDAEINM